MRHFRQAMENVRPTITDEIMDYYERVEERFRGSNEGFTESGGGRIGFQ
jgi:transitional endoplasmic reticulum ATPase